MNQLLIYSQYILAGITFLFGTYFMFRKPIYVIYITLILVALGQFARLPIMTEIGIPISDLFLPWIVFIWFCQKLFFHLYKKIPFPKTKFGIYILIFLLITTISLLINFPSLPFGDFVSSAFYFVRLVAYLLYFFICVEQLTDENNQKNFLIGLFICAVILGISGIIQLIIFPDFKMMAEEYGWDPHIGRLLSTWFDPNYLAGFFAFIISLYLPIWLYTKEKMKCQNILFILSILFIGVCFILTYSRSGIVALGISILIIGLIYARYLIIIAILVGSIAVISDDRVQERFLGLSDSIISYATGSIDFDLDPTSKLRVESWTQSTKLAEEYFLVGAGYNTMKFRNMDRGYVVDENAHSASGSDSSLLNILITTGLLGLFVYLFWFYRMLLESMKLYLNKNTNSVTKGFTLGFFAGIVGLLFHSFFVNSLLFPFVMLVIIPLMAILDRKIFSKK